jgi:hypothetical protein
MTRVEEERSRKKQQADDEELAKDIAWGMNMPKEEATEYINTKEWIITCSGGGADNLFRQEDRKD